MDSAQSAEPSKFPEFPLVRMFMKSRNVARMSSCAAESDAGLPDSQHVCWPDVAAFQRVSWDALMQIMLNIFGNGFVESGGAIRHVSAQQRNEHGDRNEIAIHSSTGRRKPWAARCTARR